MELDNIKGPTVEETHQRVVTLPLIQQFKNSLRFVNTSTNMTLDRMITALDRVGIECYADGFNAGLIAAKKAFEFQTGQVAQQQKPKDIKEVLNGGTSISSNQQSNSPSNLGSFKPIVSLTQASSSADEPKKS